MNRPK